MLFEDAEEALEWHYAQFAAGVRTRTETERNGPRQTHMCILNHPHTSPLQCKGEVAAPFIRMRHMRHVHVLMQVSEAEAERVYSQAYTAALAEQRAAAGAQSSPPGATPPLPDPASQPSQPSDSPLTTEPTSQPAKPPKGWQNLKVRAPDCCLCPFVPLLHDT